MNLILALLLFGTGGIAKAEPRRAPLVTSIRVRAFNFQDARECDKYCWFELKVTEVLALPSTGAMRVGDRIQVAALSIGTKPAVGEFVFALEPYGTQKDRWIFAPGSLATLVADNELECKSSGGEFQRVCMKRFYKCVKPYPDGGRTCSDRSECMGGCYWISKGAKLPKLGTESTGECRRNNFPCGCFVQVNQGKAREAMCAD